jgi:hypothetical protein
MVVPLLLRAGADRYARNKHGFSALDYALQAFGEEELFSAYNDAAADQKCLNGESVKSSISVADNGSVSGKSAQGAGTAFTSRKELSCAGRLMNLLIYDPVQCNICRMVKLMNYEVCTRVQQLICLRFVSYTVL